MQAEVIAMLDEHQIVGVVVGVIAIQVMDVEAVSEPFNQPRRRSFGVSLEPSLMIRFEARHTHTLWG